MSLLEAASRFESALADFDAGLVSVEDAGRVAKVLARVGKRCDAVRTRAAARVTEAGGRGALAEVALDAGKSLGQVRHEIETIQAAEEIPELADAIERGDVSLAQGAEIAKTEAEVPGSVAEAGCATPGRCRVGGGPGAFGDDVAESPEEAKVPGPPTTTDDLEAVCEDCGNRFRLQIDHINPVANGGLTELVNLARRCPPCHKIKTEHDRKAGLLTGAQTWLPDEAHVTSKKPRTDAVGGGSGERGPPRLVPA